MHCNNQLVIIKEEGLSFSREKENINSVQEVNRFEGIICVAKICCPFVKDTGANKKSLTWQNHARQFQSRDRQFNLLSIVIDISH